MLLGAAKLLKAREAKLSGTVRLLFQPAEEGGNGARAMINEGVFLFVLIKTQTTHTHTVSHTTTAQSDYLVTKSWAVQCFVLLGGCACFGVS